MALQKALQELEEKAQALADVDLNEAQTKSALISPFIRALGYDTTNVFEVVPEYRPHDAPFGQDQLIDFAILINGEPAILIECKRLGDPLEVKSVNQLFRYFVVTEARIGILTNGIRFKFFSDLDESHKMDQRPFMEFDLLNLDDRIVEELNRFARDSFDVDATIRAAETLKYTRGMKQSLARQMNDPDDGFVTWLAKEVYSGPLMKKTRARFTKLVASAFREFINERINLTLKTAMNREAGNVEAEDDGVDSQAEISEEDDGIITTVEELEGHAFVKAILLPVLGENGISRVTMRDMKTLCSIVMDGKATRVICKFYFNNPDRLRLAVRDEAGNESTHDIDSPSGVFAFAEQIKVTAQKYLE